MTLTHDELRADIIKSCPDNPMCLNCKALLAVVEIHKPRGFYDLCSHEEHDDDTPVVFISDGFTCSPLKYLICASCCGDEETDLCDNEHSHGKDLPFCPTIQAISTALEGK